MNDNKLHLIPVLEKGQTYDASTGTVILNNEGSIFVTIKQYQEDEKEIKELEQKKKNLLEFARQKWEQHAKEGWSKRKLDENYKANTQEWEKLNNESQTIKSKYEDVNWCWQLVGNKLNYNNLSHNESFSKGISQIQSLGKQKVAFPALLVGGGMAWLEAFHEKEGAVGKIPNGIYVKAKGTPKILRTEWTDFNYQPIVETIGFMSKVILHIYTSGMYGQEVEIELKDRDLFTANDQLSFSGQSAFVKEVNILKVKKNDIGKIEVADLIKREQSTTDNIVEKEQYTQKIEVEVLVDAIWEIEGGKELKIFPTIKSKETGAYFEDFDRSYLSVAEKSLIFTATKEVSNNVALIGAVETNESAFHHCQYTEITLEYENESVEIFKENPGVSYKSNVEIGLILGSEPKKFSIKVDKDSDASECRFVGKENDHGKKMFSFDKTKLPKNVSITKNDPKSIEGKAYFDYDEHNIFNYIWPTKSINGNIPVLNINTATCRHQHNMNFKIYPDVVWALAFTFSLKNPLAYTYSAGKDNRDRFDEDNKDSAKGELIYAEAHKKAYNSGNDRNKLRQGKAVDGELTISLKGKYNKIADSVPTRYRNEFEYGPKIEQKLNYFLDKLLYIKKIAQDAKEATGGAARKSDLVGDQPFSFEIQSPKIGAVIEWKAEEVKEGKYKGQICNTGVMKIVADPLLGAEFTINMLALAAKMNPVVFAIKEGVDIGLNALGGYMKLDAVFYGSINITIETLKLNSLEGFKLTDKPPKIDGKMGIKVVFEIKIKGSISVSKFIPKLDFDAAARAEIHAYFGGTSLIKADDQGVYMDTTVKFSGLIFMAEGEIKVGRFKAKPFKVSPVTIWDSEQLPLGKIYLI